MHYHHLSWSSKRHSPALYAFWWLVHGILVNAWRAKVEQKMLYSWEDLTQLIWNTCCTENLSQWTQLQSRQIHVLTFAFKVISALYQNIQKAQEELKDQFEAYRYEHMCDMVDKAILPGVSMWCTFLAYNLPLLAQYCAGANAEGRNIRDNDKRELVKVNYLLTIFSRKKRTDTQLYFPGVASILSVPHWSFNVSWSYSQHTSCDVSCFWRLNTPWVDAACKIPCYCRLFQGEHVRKYRWKERCCKSTNSMGSSSWIYKESCWIQRK